MKVQFNTVLVLFMAIAMVSLVSCSKKSTAESQGMPDIYKDAPSWVFTPEIEGGLASVGTSKIGKAGLGFARNEALADGRDQLARQMAVKVKNMVKNFTQTTGIGDAETVDKVAVQVSKQITSQMLSGSRMKSMWRAPNDELFVWVVMDPEEAREVAKAAALTSYKNDQALWQQFQSSKAHDELEKEVEKEFKDFNSAP